MKVPLKKERTVEENTLEGVKENMEKQNVKLCV